MAYDFHYTPTGTGVISGKEVLEQTEDAINDLGNTAISGVQEALDKAEQALTNSENAVDDAQTALNTANNAEGVAIQAQTDVGNLSGTVTNIGNRVTTAEGNITNLQGRMTTAEGNITNIQGRMTTAETNIGNLQTAVSTAQATANSAQQTATTARQQSYVFRYSGTAITDNSTIAYSTIDNTDNIKSGDKILDVDGKLFEITAVDTTNQTVTVGSALIDLALDGNVVHTSGNETVGGQKTFANNLIIVGRNTDSNSAIQLVNSDVVGGSANGTSGLEVYGSSVSTDNKIGGVTIGEWSNNGGSYAIIECNRTVSDVKTSNTIRNFIRNDGSKEFSAGSDNDCKLGHPYFRWSEVYATKYYYGSNNVEFSTKFVTTDTVQTITNPKTFTSTPSFTGYPSIRLYSPTDDVNVLPSAHEQREIRFTDKNNILIAYFIFQHRTDANEPFRTCWRQSRLDGTEKYYSVNFNNLGEFYPENNNGIKLGTSTRRWSDCQTNLINGLTPSSLSMPVAPSSTSYVDISGYITVLDSSSANTYTPPSNGYITFSVTGNLVQIFHDYGLQGKWTVQAGNVNRGFIPVLGGVEVKIYLTASSVDKFWFIPCQGNI